VPARPIIVFDVNETLLDLDSIRPTFDRIFRDPAAMRLWFAEAYHSVAAALQLDPGGICLIASHVWDTIGAAAAGWQAALILREGNAPLDVGPQPDYIGKDLDAIADQLIEKYA
jgi:2-haloacid dehalogenase